MLFSLVKKSKIATLSAVCLALLLPGFASAEMIVNVQFYIAGTTANMQDVGGTLLNQGPVASADTTPYWNQFTGAGFQSDLVTGYPGANTLTQADGTASGISLTMSGSWLTDGTNRGTGQIPVFWGVAFMENGGTETQTALFSGLKTDGTKYALYALGSVVPTADTRFTVNGDTAGAIRLRGATQGFSLTYDSTMNLTSWVTASTDAAGDDFVSTANTAYFAELTPTAGGTLSVVSSYANEHRWNDGNPKPFAGVAGYQLVELVPEPNTVPLVGASIVGLLMLRRMRRK